MIRNRQKPFGELRATKKIIPLLAVAFVFLLLLRRAPGQEITAYDPGKARINTIRLTGNTVLGAEELDLIVSPYTQKDLGLAELQEVARSITEVYKKKGYSLARAYIPQQEIKDGVVEIVVLEGKLGEIIIQGNKNYSADFIRRGFARVIADKAINQNALEKSLLLLNENPALKVTAVLEAGKEPGSTNIIVKAEEKLPLHFAVDYNNFGTKFVSKHRFGVELTFSKFLIVEGSSLSLRGVMGADPNALLYGAASYLLPVNDYGTKLGWSGFGGSFVLGREFAELGVKGNSWGYGVALSHPVIKTRFQDFRGEFGFESKDTKQSLLGTLFGRDKVRMLKVGFNYTSIDGTGRNFLSLHLFQGLGHALGAMENNDPKSSRLGADNRFSKFNLNLARVQRISESLSLILRGSSQVSTDSLVAGEQFFLGGADSVRGYPQAEFLGDDGYNVSTEVRIAPLANRELLQLAFFVDHGAVSLKNPQPGTKSYVHLTGVGYGLRLNLPYNFSARFDVGFPVQPSKTSSRERPALYIQTAVRF